MEDLGTDQTTQVLALQTGTARVRLHRARLSVRREICHLLKHGESLNGFRKKQQKQMGRLASASTRRLECGEFFADLSDYLDGKLEPRTCEEMRRHIEACPACVAFIRDLRLTIDRRCGLDISCNEAQLQGCAPC